MRLQKNGIGGNLHPMGGVVVVEKGNLIFVKLNNTEQTRGLKQTVSIFLII